MEISNKNVKELLKMYDELFDYYDVFYRGWVANVSKSKNGNYRMDENTKRIFKLYKDNGAILVEGKPFPTHIFTGKKRLGNNAIGIYCKNYIDVKRNIETKNNNLEANNSSETFKGRIK